MTDAPLRHRRVSKVERLSANRFHNTVRLERAAEVDRTLLGWLCQARALCG